MKEKKGGYTSLGRTFPRGSNPKRFARLVGGNEKKRQ